MTEQELHKGGIYIWRKDDPRHRSTLQVTQITKHMVRAVCLVGSAANPKAGRRFWNPKSFILDECTPAPRDEVTVSPEPR